MTCSIEESVRKAVGECPLIYTGGNGLVHQIVGANVSATTRNFSHWIGSAVGQNLPGDPRQNTVVTWGWNIASNGTPEDPTDAAFSQNWEEHYVQGGIGTRAAFEWHQVVIDLSNNPHRVLTGFFPKDGGAGSDFGMQVDAVYLGDYNAVRTLTFDNKNKAIRYGAAGMTHVSDTTGFSFDGNVATVGPFAGTFLNMLCKTAVDGNTLFAIYGPNVVGNVTAQKIQCPATGTLVTQVYNPSNAANASAEFNIITGGASGDAFIRYATGYGAKMWLSGLDGADGKFKWGTWILGQQDKMVLDTSANLSLVVVGGGFRVKEGSNAKQGVATLVAGTVTVANTSVTANSRIFLTSQSDGGKPGFLRVSSRVAGESFTMTSSSPCDISVVAYEIFEPA